jgi:hypothetical protein
MNGERLMAKFESMTLDLARSEGSEENRLPTILQSWFGPDAGKPGTDHHVLFERREGGWHAAPRSGAGTGDALRVGKSYRREDVAIALGTTYRGQTWQSGIVTVGNRILLFVTLNKTTMDERYVYKDKFLSSEVFQWQSQNQTTQHGVVGRRLREHREQGLEIHLFVRRDAKSSGRTMPFFYCGVLDFIEWEGERPITVKWQLKQPLTDGLWEHLRVTG